MTARIAILFDNTDRPETTGTYCLRTLEALARDGHIAAVAHVLPGDLPRLVADRDQWDLIVAIDDGLACDLPPGLPPVAWWAIDTHGDYDRCLARARQSRWTFAAQQDGVERLQRDGITATWLPLACDSERHGRQKVDLKYDVCFVGCLIPGERSRLIQKLSLDASRVFVSQSESTVMAPIYSGSRIVFHRGHAQDISPRVFEALASGSLLITNGVRDNGLGILFQDGRHLGTYGDDAELVEKLGWYLSHTTECERIAAAGRDEVLATHTYRHRMEQLLGCVAPTDHRPGTTVHNVAAASAMSRENFESDRPDVLELVPRSTHRMLDVGCGTGRLGASLKSRQTVHVTGVEFNPDAAARARSRLDDVQIVNLETADVEFAELEFDCVICADILEHLRQPERVLRNIRRWLRPDGCLVVSLPNVRHHSVVRSLLAGNWTYESAGLLDADHVRFFTRRELEKLLFRCGFDVGELRMVPGDGYAEWVASGRPQQVSMGGLQVRTRTADEAAEFFTCQYLVRCHPKPSHHPLISDCRDLTAGLQRLAEQCAWPKERPEVALPTEHPGWMGDGTRVMLRQETRQDVRLVVELGTWLGLSTRFLADHAPQATIITIDHWQGNPEHQQNPAWSAMLPTLYESFLSLSWDYRDRIQPLRMSTIEGLQAVAAAGLEPDLIFVDASHEYESVHADLTACRRLFPQSVLVGDDYDDPIVQRAVQELAESQGLTIDTTGSSWRAWKLVDPSRRLSDSTPVSSLDHGLTSIILVTWNQRHYTQRCLDSIRLRTDELIEIIVVDNGSTDGTVEWLRTQPDVRLMTNPDNRGFPAAANQGLQAARGHNLLLLNNDTVVTTGWLRRMLDVLHSNPQIGLVGPVTNCVSGEQQIPVAYDNLTDLDGWAWERQRELLYSASGDSQRKQPLIEDTDRLVGFCLLLKRDVLEDVGLLDERFGIGCFEDDDLCRRARDAGYRAVIAMTSFVHHFGSATFQGSGTDLGQVLKTNEQLYHEKWGQNGGSHADMRGRGEETGSPETAADREIPVPRGTPRPEFLLVQDDDGNLLIQPNTMRLSGCLIVRNNEHTIRACLESLKPWVDEIIVVDTGSTDATPQICEELGARVFHWPWRDDFAAARNVSLDHARGEWIFWMDSDDTLPHHCGEKLQRLVSELDPRVPSPPEGGEGGRRPDEGADCSNSADEPSTPISPSPCPLPRVQGRGTTKSIVPEPPPGKANIVSGPLAIERQLAPGQGVSPLAPLVGYVMQVHCPGDEPGDVTIVDHVKLIRNRPDLRFEFRIHEQILPAIRRAGGNVEFTDIYVVHSGSDRTRDGQARKLERDFRLLNRELQDRPDHPFVLFNLGMTHEDCGEYAEAIWNLLRCLEVSDPEESHVRKAYALLISSLMQARQAGAAERYCRKGLELFPDDKELLFRQAMLDHQAGRLEESAAMYQRVLAESCKRHFTSIDAGLAGTKARHNLAIVYEESSHWDQAEEQWRAILQETPDYAPAWRGTGECLLQQNRDSEVAVLCETLASRPDGRREELILRGQLAVRRGDRDTAIRHWEQADQLDPSDTAALRLICRREFEDGCWAEAVIALEDLTHREPQDASAWQNLGVARLGLKQIEGAIAALRTSLRIRPNYASAQSLLNELLALLR